MWIMVWDQRDSYTFRFISRPVRIRGMTHWNSHMITWSIWGETALCEEILSYGLFSFPKARIWVSMLWSSSGRDADLLILRHLKGSWCLDSVPRKNPTNPYGKENMRIPSLWQRQVPHGGSVSWPTAAYAQRSKSRVNNRTPKKAPIGMPQCFVGTSECLLTQLVPLFSFDVKLNIKEF